MLICGVFADRFKNFMIIVLVASFVGGKRFVIVCNVRCIYVFCKLWLLVSVLHFKLFFTYIYS